MELVDGYVHQSGVHCGASALRNVTAHYGWNYSEATCFGVGGGPAFVLYEHPHEPWVTFRASPTWLERAFFERLGVPHLHRAGDDIETAWETVTDHVDENDPVILFLDPASIDYLPEDPAHVPPHVTVLIGYDDETALLSDAAMEEPQEVSRSTLEAAWSHETFGRLENESLVVTRAARTEDETDAVAAGLRQAATYVVDPLAVKRDARGPGEEGLPAIRSFGDYVGRWPELPEPARPVRIARRSIDEHGDGTAYRGLFAESLAELGQRTDLPPSLADRMDATGSQWNTVAERLEEILEHDDPQPALYEEAATLIGNVADSEAGLFADLHGELGPVDD
ncbi:BtrH N-terminal domain-containing protein [Halobacteria archaeon AArc-curdl1]|uniref:BtrH N-terminal domain-containing protein n=1 Tax=Natronosalvus hydrolyticus TaxID=2979988 RepID=A0AAP3E4U3_9EURY|nr:BtrH N-terminal domain-containing protein [Halobacteria archaeon AArc-curdl1]